MHRGGNGFQYFTTQITFNENLRLRFLSLVQFPLKTYYPHLVFSVTGSNGVLKMSIMFFGNTSSYHFHLVPLLFGVNELKNTIIQFNSLIGSSCA